MFWSQSARCKPSQGLGAATALLCAASQLGPSQRAGKGLLANVRDAAEQLELFCITLSSDKTHQASFAWRNKVNNPCPKQTPFQCALC